MLLPAAVIVSADIKNCRLLIITPPRARPTRVIGRTTDACQHDPPQRFGSPNGAFPMTNGHYLVTEINGDWVDEMSLDGAVSRGRRTRPGCSTRRTATRSARTGT